MSWPPKRAIVHVHRMIGEKLEQGTWCATGELGDYKSALSNAMHTFVRDVHPPAGRYLIIAPDQPYPPDGEGASLIFTVRYPVAVLECNGRQEIVGGDFRWSHYAIQSDPQWGKVNETWLARSEGSN